jgi:hypothetical protein
MNKKSFKAALDAAIITAIVETTKTYDQIAQEFGVGRRYIDGLAARHKIRRKRGRGSPAFPNGQN